LLQQLPSTIVFLRVADPPFQMALANTAAAKLSNRKLAEYLEVSHTFVANERKMWDLCGNVAIPEVRYARRTTTSTRAGHWP
jgi:hypothetical protein